MHRLTATGSPIFVPIDHGLTMGAIDGLGDVAETVTAVRDGGADAVVAHKGLSSTIVGVAPELEYIAHLNGATTATPPKHTKSQVTAVEEAVAHGATAVSYHINVGAKQESEQLRELGEVSATASDLGIPLLVMAYPRGRNVDGGDPGDVAHAARVAWEVGADMVKVPLPPNGFGEVVDAVDIPVLAAGGSNEGIEPTFADAVYARECGAAGVCMGRSVFQSRTPEGVVKGLVSIFDGGWDVDAAKTAVEGVV